MRELEGKRDSRDLADNTSHNLKATITKSFRIGFNWNRPKGANMSTRECCSLDSDDFTTFPFRVARSSLDVNKSLYRVAASTNVGVLVFSVCVNRAVLPNRKCFVYGTQGIRNSMVVCGVSAPFH